MHLYRTLSAPTRAAGRVGQGPAIGDVVNGTQQLHEDVAANIMMFLQNRYFTLDPVNQGLQGATGYLAVTPEKILQSGGQLEGQQTAAQQLAELGAEYIALASVPDTQAVLAAQPVELYHIVVVDSLAGAQTLAQPNSNYAVLKPRLSATPTKATTTTTSAGLSSAAILGAIAGAVGGFLVGGPVGALVGAVAVGAIVNASQK